jgi:2-oxoglutarate ferredoxin oxidoreductase subunit beta
MTATYQPAIPIWCAGCGHFGVQAAMNGAIRTLEIPPHETMILAGIGCSGTVQNNLGTYGYHALHGRVLPTAAGVHLANPDLTVIATGGDGDGYAIGMGHLVHSFRRNASFIYVVMNNGVYGLTKGQNSPTFQSNGSAALEFDAISLGLSIPSTSFLARGFARWTDQLDRLMLAAVEHARAGRGFAFIEVLSPCVTYNDTYPVWEASLHDLDADGDHDPTDRAAVFAKLTSLAETGRMAVGQIYRADAAAAGDPLPRPAAEDTSPLENAQAYAEILNRYRV